MLEKITNINRNPRYKGGRKSLNFEEFLQKQSIEKDFGKDSIIFSPAAQFLSKLNWRLKSIKYLSNEKLFLHFFISNIEFKTELDIDRFYSDVRHDFEMIKEGQKPGQRLKSLLKLSFKKEQMFPGSDFADLQPTGLDSLFERIFDLHIDTQIDKQDSYALKTLLDGIEEKIGAELNILISSLHVFLQKLSKSQTYQVSNFQEDHTEPIIIEKISTVHV